MTDDKTLASCINKYNITKNYAGFPSIPPVVSATKPELEPRDTHKEWQDLNQGLVPAGFVPTSPEPSATHFRAPYASDQAKDFAAWWQEQTHTQWTN